MQVVYADKELARCAGDKAYAVRKMGQRRAGQWACDLDHPYRLIFKPVMNSDGNIIGLIIEQTVSILEIVDYHE